MTSRIVLSPTGTSGLGITLVMGFKRVPLPPAIITTGRSIFSRCSPSDCLKKSLQKYTSTRFPSSSTTGIHSARRLSIFFRIESLESAGDANFLFKSIIDITGWFISTPLIIARWISPIVRILTNFSPSYTNNILTFVSSIFFRD